MILNWNFVKIWERLAIPRRMPHPRNLKKAFAITATVFCAVYICNMLTYPSTRYYWMGGQLAEFKEIAEVAHGQIKNAILREKGSGCNVPAMELYSEEIMRFLKPTADARRVVCEGTDWVSCHKSECYVKPEMLERMRDIECSYADIVYVDDHTYWVSEWARRRHRQRYALNRSDHVKVACTGTDRNGSGRFLGIIPSRWSGHKTGLRPVPVKPSPPERKDSLNVLILAFDSASHNGFLRQMPKSYKYLSELANAVILNSYSAVGDGTSAALFPIFTGKAEMEQFDSRKKMGKDRYVNQSEFIFRHLKEDGYRTAYLEDMPWVGSFQYRFNGFSHQPADHYLRPVLMEEAKTWKRLLNPFDYFCFGDIPNYQLLMDLSLEFLELDGKKFCFTFVADISHNDFSMISNADNATVQLLRALADRRLTDNMLVIVMGDHGSRFGDIRFTYQGRLEERLPLMAMILPDQLLKRRPGALEALKHNRDVLTTHFDLHTTILDAVDLKQYANNYTEPGADIPRAMSLLEKIPAWRTCGEAGVVPHWCVCARWYNVSDTEPGRARAAHELADYIDSLSAERRDVCAVRALTSVEWVMRQESRDYEVVTAKSSWLRNDNYFGSGSVPIAPKEYYQAKIIMSPGRGVFEGTLVYDVRADRFLLSDLDISRTSAYGDEADCVSATHPHLSKFCFCKNKLLQHQTTVSTV